MNRQKTKRAFENIMVEKKISKGNDKQYFL